MVITHGAPKNYDSQCPKHSDKYAAKKTSHRSQKNIASEFGHQAATRVSQAMIIDELYYTINDESDF